MLNTPLSVITAEVAESLAHQIAFKLGVPVDAARARDLAAHAVQIVLSHLEDGGAS